MSFLRIKDILDVVFARASSAYKKDGTTVASGEVRYENIADPIVVNKGRLWDAGTHVRTAASGNLLVSNVVPTFTRSTSGWVDGVAVAANTPRYIAPTNLLTGENDLSNAAWVKTSGTVTANAGTDPDGGSNADYGTGAGAFNQFIVSQSITPVAHSTNYTFVFYVKLDDADDVTFTINDSNGTYPGNATLNSAGLFSVSTGTGGSTSVGDGWYKIWVTTDTSYTDNLTGVEIGTSGGNAYFYGMHFHQGATSGNTSAGIIIEEGTTNLLTYSDTTVAQTSSASNVSDSAFGYTFSNGVYFGDNSVQRWAYKTNTMSPSTTYTLSVYVKMDDGSVPVPGANSSENDFSFVFNNSNTGITYVVTQVSSSIYRVSGTYTFPSGAVSSNHTGIIKYTGHSSKGFKVTGYQLEQKSYATSYIPTTSATATRNAETLTVPNMSQFVSATSGTIKTRVMPLRNPGTDIQMITNLGGTGASGIYLAINTAGKFSFRYGSLNSSAGLSSTTTVVANTWYDIEVGWASGNYTLKINDAVESSGSVATTPAVLYTDDILWVGAMSGIATRYADSIIDYLEFTKDGEVTRFDFNNTIAPSTDAAWTSPWYDSTVSGAIWESFAATKTTPTGTTNSVEFRTSASADGSGASAWTSSLPATGQYIQAKITLNPNGESTYPYVTDLTITPKDYGKGVYIEEATTNLFAAPTAPASENVTVTANGDYTLSVYGNDTSSGSVVITHEKIEDSQADFSTGTLVGVEALSSGAIALKVEADPTFTRATVATKKDFSQVTSGNARFEELVTPFTLDLQHQFDAGTKEGVTTSSGAVSVDFTPTFTRASTATNNKLEVIPSGQIRYDDLVAPITVDTQFDWENSGTKDSILTTASSGDLTMINGTPTFTRDTVAYKKDGTQVASGAARYEQGKNLLAYSEDFTAWSSSSVTVTANNTLAPDGTLTADRITSTGSNGYVSLLTSSSPSTSYTFSVWLRADTTTNLRILAHDGFTYGPTTDITVTTEWQRFSYTRTTGASASSIRTYIGGDSLFTTGETIYAWGAQLELGSSVTTYSKGGQSAIMIEETTTNLLTANQSDVEVDLTGITSNGSVTMTRDTTEKWQGTASIKTITNGAATEEGTGTGVSTTVTSGTIYTASVWIKGSGTVFIGLQEFSDADAYLRRTVSSNTTLTGVWQRITVTATVGADCTKARIIIRTSSIQATTFYVDGLQLEQKAYATSWHIGGGTRNIENLTIPASTINPTSGSVIIRTYVSGEKNKATPSRNHWLFTAAKDSTGLPNRIGLVRTNSGWYQMQVSNDSSTSTTATWATGAIAEGWHTFGLRWSASKISLYMDGVERASANTPNIPTGAINTVYIGNWASGGDLSWSDLIDEVSIFHEALSDSDMAILTAI